MTYFRGTALKYGGWDANGVQFYHYSKWREELARRIAAPAQAPILYIHGYNNSHLDALARGSAIGQATGREVIVMTWPSYGGLTKYFWDEANAEWSMAEARSFFDDITRIRPDMTVIAHSMGNRLALDMLQSWRVRNSGNTPPIKQLIMASPDVDRQWFLAHLRDGLGIPITLYGSTKDQPLSASWRSHGHARAGDLSRWVTGNDNDYPFDQSTGIVVVDTSAVSRGIGHGDFIETGQGAADLCRLVNALSTDLGRNQVTDHPTTWTLLKNPGGTDACTKTGITAAKYLGNRKAGRFLERAD
jgi:esterase/lipase superfamily enzyme